MLKKCYHWLKAHRLRKINERAAAAAAKKKAKSGGKPPKARSLERRLSYHKPSKAIVCGGNRFPIAAFSEVVKAENELKRRYFVAGLDAEFREKGEASKEAGPGAGYPGLYKCRVERLRSVGPQGKSTQFNVYHEGSRDLIIAARSVSGTSFSLSMNDTDFDTLSESSIGYLTCNFLGTTFTLHDFGMPGCVI